MNPDELEALADQIDFQRERVLIESGPAGSINIPYYIINQINAADQLRAYASEKRERAQYQP